MSKNVRRQMDKKLAREFIFSGHAVLTCHNTETGNHKTFMIDKSDDGKVHFFKIRGDKDGLFQPITRKDRKKKKNWIYVGMTKPDGTFITTKNSKVTWQSQSFKSVQWLLIAANEWAMDKDLCPQVEVYHEGFCGRCGRTLTDPNSIQAGYGPECLKKVQHG